MSDFMGGMFDFDGDGHTDIGEEFMAYQIYEDMTEKKTDSVLDCGCNLLMID